MRVHPPEMRQQVALEDRLKLHLNIHRLDISWHFLNLSIGPKLYCGINSCGHFLSKQPLGLPSKQLGHPVTSATGPGKLWASTWRGPGSGSSFFAKPKNRNGTATLEPWNPDCCWVAKLG